MQLCTNIVGVTESAFNRMFLLPLIKNGYYLKSVLYAQEYGNNSLNSIAEHTA